MPKSLSKAFINQDIYGYKMGVNYKGMDSYKTKMGAFCTLAGYILILAYSMTLFIAFFDNSNQLETTQIKQTDLFFGDAHYFADNDFYLTTFTYPKLPENVGKIKVYQYSLCIAPGDNDSVYQDFLAKDENCSAAGELKKEVKVDKCDD